MSDRPLAVNLRRARRRAGLSVVDLARRSGVARATLTQLEAGAGNPTLETLYALADQLGVPLAELIADDTPSTRPRVVRRGEGRPSRGAVVEARLLAHPPGVEIYAVTLHPGPAQTSGPHPPGTREHLHLHTGDVRVGPVDGPLDLTVGDYADYPADVVHTYVTRAEEPATATLVIVSG